MTSTQRHEARYQRRKAKRERLKRERAENFTPESVFTFEALFKAGKKACNGVRWKQSTQNFELHLFSRTAKNRQSLLNDTWKSDRYFHFTLHERGKTREIDAPRIIDRQVHKTLTQRLLIPIYKPYMIYNNGASMKGKGLMFSMNVLKDDLRRHVRKYGMRGEVLILDFEKFFPTASHDVVFERHDKLIQDARLKDVLTKAGMLRHGGKGLPL
ncbi:MAG: hypothetical protein LUD47_01755, partial [Clostridia bacterium]|nr:hypothetical protein [Clostridia bacterium]